MKSSSNVEKKMAGGYNLPGDDDEEQDSDNAGGLVGQVNIDDDDNVDDPP